ncbi:MAG: cell division protein SepF [Clostridia bacterium]|nr:cell division protein SepF [Clostridia bacterium]
MAVGDLFGNLKNSVKTAYNNFFYSGRQAPPTRTKETYQDAQNQAYSQQEAGYQQQNAYQQPYQQQGAYQQPYQQQGAYQQPYQQQGAYQQSYQQQGAYQQSYQQQGAYQQPYQQQPQSQSAQGRARRMQMHAGRQQENVVDFGSYQQSMGRQPVQPDQSAEASVQEAAQQTASLMSARVINARGMGDCRSAITLLRNGDAVVIVMENIAEPSEMRRLVDTLSGACYSLTATITKVSRHGVYLLAPQTMAVFADQATNTMNSAPARPQARNYQPGFMGQRVTYAPQQQAAQPGQPQPQQPYAGGQAFTQRAAAPEEARQNFYQRPAPQMAQPPAFSAQPAGYGYAPDDMQAAGDQ